MDEGLQEWSVLKGGMSREIFSLDLDGAVAIMDDERMAIWQSGSMTTTASCWQ